MISADHVVVHMIRTPSKPSLVPFPTPPADVPNLQVIVVNCFFLAADLEEDEGGLVVEIVFNSFFLFEFVIRITGNVGFRIRVRGSSP